MADLTFEVFQTLMAIGWIDGRLDPEEGDAILKAALDAGLWDEQIEQLDLMQESPVDFTDLDTTALSTEQRLYVYAVASWVARADNEVTAAEDAALHAVATVIGVTGKGRRAMDLMVEDLRGTEAAPARLDLVGMRAHIVSALTEAHPRAAPD